MDSSRAIRSPVTVTARAANLVAAGMVMMGVFSGRKFEEIISPVTMLPQARRFRGLIIAGLFSLMGDIARNRGVPIVTRKIIRRL